MGLVLLGGGYLAFVLRPIRALGIEVVVVIRLLEVLNPVDVHQDWFGLWCGSELEVHFPHHVRDGVDAFPLLNELPVRCPGSSVEVDEASVPHREFPRLGLLVVCSTSRAGFLPPPCVPVPPYRPSPAWLLPLGRIRLCRMAAGSLCQKTGASARGGR